MSGDTFAMAGLAALYLLGSVAYSLSCGDWLTAGLLVLALALFVRAMR